MYLAFLCELVGGSYERQSILFNQEGQLVLKAIADICQDIFSSNNIDLLVNYIWLLAVLE